MAEVLTASLLDGVPHGFSTSDTSGMEQVLPGAGLIRLRQVHSADVVTVASAQPWKDEERPEADAMVTGQPGCLLAIVTADCAPVLLADLQAGVVGAAHAGWRGAHAGALENTVTAMQALGADPARIMAAIGPTIAKASYEVDEGFRAHFTADEAGYFSTGKPGHYQFDLPAYVRARLGRAGVTRVEDLAQDTYTQPKRFHSFRRATHLGAPTEGRQLSVIACAPPVA